MSKRPQPTDLELAALISSKICHDVINPVGAAYNGLEVLDEDDDPQTQAYALDVVRNVTKQAWAQLEFARLAFGAADSAGATIDLATAAKLSSGYLGAGKHRLVWEGPDGHVAKDCVKLLLNLVACSVTCLPRGGDIKVTISGALEKPSFVIRCHGKGACPPLHLTDFIIGTKPPALNPMTIQAYYTWRLAASACMRLEILRDDADILLSAKSIA